MEKLVSSKRNSQPSPSILESEESELCDRLTDYLLLDLETYCSTDQLRTLSKSVKATFASYNEVIVKYVSHLRNTGAITEANELIQNFTAKRGSYRAMIKQINGKCESLEEDNISSMSSSTFGHAYSPGRALTTSEKVEGFLRSQQKSNHSESFSTPAKYGMLSNNPDIVSDARIFNFV